MPNPEPLTIEVPAEVELTDEAMDAIAELLIEDWEREQKRLAPH